MLRGTSEPRMPDEEQATANTNNLAYWYLSCPNVRVIQHFTKHARHTTHSGHSQEKSKINKQV
jgi:hypothetical protein